MVMPCPNWSTLKVMSGHLYDLPPNFHVWIAMHAPIPVRYTAVEELNALEGIIEAAERILEPISHLDFMILDVAECSGDCEGCERLDECDYADFDYSHREE